MVSRIYVFWELHASQSDGAWTYWKRSTTLDRMPVGLLKARLRAVSHYRYAELRWRTNVNASKTLVSAGAVSTLPPWQYMGRDNRRFIYRSIHWTRQSTAIILVEALSCCEEIRDYPTLAHVSRARKRMRRSWFLVDTLVFLDRIC